MHQITPACQTLYRKSFFAVLIVALLLAGSCSQRNDPSPSLSEGDELFRNIITSHVEDAELDTPSCRRLSAFAFAHLLTPDEFSVDSLKMALAIARSYKENMSIGTLSNALAVWCQYHNHYSDAGSYYSEASGAFAHCGNVSGLVKTQLNQAVLMNTLGDSKTSLALADTVLQFLVDQGSRGEFWIQAQTIKASALLNSDNSRAALEVLHVVRPYIDRPDDLINHFGNMASGYQSCRILDSMSIYQDSAMSLAQFQEQPNYRTIAELLRGRAHGMIGTMTEEELARHGPDVLGLLDSSANIANQIGQPHMAVAIDGLKSEFYLRIGECDTAFTIYKEYVERSKELLSVGKYLPILQEASLFRVREMELEHQIETRDKKRKVIWLSSLVIVFGALLLMFAFQWITQDDRRKAWMKSALMIVVLMIYEMIVLYIVNTDVFASVEHGSFYLSVLLLLIVAWLLHHLRQEVEGWINNPPRFRKRSAGYGT